MHQDTLQFAKKIRFAHWPFNYFFLKSGFENVVKYLSNVDLSVIFLFRLLRFGNRSLNFKFFLPLKKDKTWGDLWCWLHVVLICRHCISVTKPNMKINNHFSGIYVSY
jgi:hypothetical protein